MNRKSTLKSKQILTQNPSMDANFTDTTNGFSVLGLRTTTPKAPRPQTSTFKPPHGGDPESTKKLQDGFSQGQFVLRKYNSQAIQRKDHKSPSIMNSEKNIVISECPSHNYDSTTLSNANRKWEETDSVICSYIVPQSPSQVYREVYSKDRSYKKLQHMASVSSKTNVEEQLRQVIEQQKEQLRKYELFFKKINMETAAAVKTSAAVPEEVHTSHEKENLNLKCLLQEQKIATLVYMLKQYRGDNKNQVAKFQKQINNYEPRLEGELTAKLAEANQKNELLQEQLNVFKKQYNEVLKSSKNKDASQASTFEALLTRINEIEKQNEELQNNNKDLLKALEDSEARKQKIRALESSLKESQMLNQQLCQDLAKVEDELKDTASKLSEAERQIEDLQYELSDKAQIKQRLDAKIQALLESTRAKNRLQEENQELKFRIDAMMQEFNRKVFEQKATIEKIMQLGNQVDETKSKINSNIDWIVTQQNVPEVAKEKFVYVGHLFKKNQEAFHQMMNEYKSDMHILQKQAQNSQKAYEKLNVEKDSANEHRINEKKSAEQTRDKVHRYLEEIKKSGKADCMGCNELRSYCAQIGNLVDKHVAIF